jgi:hypothetical protein
MMEYYPSIKKNEFTHTYHHMDESQNVTEKSNEKSHM